MKVHKTISRNVVCVALLAMLFSTSLSMVGARAGDNDRPSGIVRPTPPAPVFDEKERQAELAQRRERVAQTIGSKAVLILFSAEPRVYANDVDYEYRQENNLYYLTQLKQQRATLVLLPGNRQTPEILFIPRRDGFSEVWNGRMYSAEEAAQASGIREIWEAREFEPFLQALRARQVYRPKPENVLMSTPSATSPEGAPTDKKNSPMCQVKGDQSGFECLFAAGEKNEAELYMLAPNGRGPSREYAREQSFAAEWTKTSGGFAIKNAWPIFADMRLRKSPMELRLLQHAIDITNEAQQRAWLAAGDAKWEYEVDAEVVYTFKLRNADHWGYPSIVGCGPNATTLHYIESQGEIKPGDLLLMDVGAEYEHYTADVTRTFPVNGKFSPAQAEIYQVVYDAQDAAASVIRPGAMFSDVHRAATRVISEGLLKLGLITDSKSAQYGIWFMHGTSHWLGMNVHDVGNAVKLEPGMVFTNEPGIYIRPDALDYQPPGWKQEDWTKFKATVRPAFEKYKGIGVRIEDDMLVTGDGTRWLTEALPRKMSEIEVTIANGRQASR